MDTQPCVPCCTTPQTVNVPGATGPTGLAARATVTNAFVVPAIGATVTIIVSDTSWMQVEQNLFIGDANFIVTGINSAVSVTVKFLGLVSDVPAGSTIAATSLVAPGMGNNTVAVDLDLLTAFTDSTGGTKSDTIAASLVKQTIILGPFSMALLVNSQIWELAIPYNFLVNSVLFRCDIAITTGAKAATFSTRINAVATTGGVISVAGAYATGATQAGTAITAANVGTAGQTLESIVSGVTAFTEGYGHIELNITNTDLAATLAAIAFKANQLRTALRHQ